VDAVAVAPAPLKANVIFIETPRGATGIGAIMNDEVLEFAEKIGAKDLKPIFDNSQLRGLLKRRNYFILDKETFLIVKISRSKIKTFWGIGKIFIEAFDILTEKSGNYFLVALVSDHSGWVLSKKHLRSLISEGSMSFSETQKQYKLNDYNLKSSYSFTSINGFLEKIRQNV
jgi:hypothetical protein